MLLSTWNSVLVSWANALGIVPNPINFIEDLNLAFFNNLSIRIKKRAVKTLKEAVEVIQEHYPLLVFGDPLDEHGVALLATAFFLWLSLHHLDQELCMNLCNLPALEQLHIKNVLEAFVQTQPERLTRDIIYSTLHRTPEMSQDESPSSDILFRRFSSGTPSSSVGSGKGSPASAGQQKSGSRWHILKQKYHTTLSQKNIIQEELDSAREAISTLEISLRKLEDENSLLKTEQRKRSNAVASPLRPIEPVPLVVEKACKQCKGLDVDLAILKENNVADQAELTSLRETLAEMKKKVSALESERKAMAEELMKNVDQINQMDKEYSSLNSQFNELSSQKKHLEEYIEEMKQSSRSLNTLDEPPLNLASEVVDLQLHELRAELERKESECETILGEKLALDKLMKEKESLITSLTNEVSTVNAKVLQCNALLDSLNLEKKVLSEQLEMKTLEVTAMENDLKDARKKITELYSDFKNQDEKTSLLESEKAQLKAIVDDVRCRLIQSVKKNEELITNVETTVHENDELLVQLTDANSKVTNLEVDLEHKKQQLLSSESKNSELLISVDHLKGLNRESACKIDELTLKLLTVERQTTDEIEQLVGYVEKSANQVQKLEEALVTAENGSLALKERVTELLENSVVDQQTISTISSELESKNSTIADINQQLSEMQETLQHTKETLAIKMEDLATMQKVESQLVETNRSLESRVTEYKTIMDEQTESLNKKVFELEEITRTLGSVKTDNVELSEKLRSKVEDFAKLEAENALHVQTIRGLEEKIINFSSQLMAKTTEAVNLTHQLEETLKKVAEANEAMTAKETEVGLLKAKVSKFLEKSAVDEKNIAKLSEELISNQLMMTELNEQFTQANDQYLKKYSCIVVEKEDEIALLQRAIDGFKEEKISLETQLTDKEKVIEEQTVTLQSKQEIENKLIADLSSASDEVKILSDRLVCQENLLAELETKMAELINQQQILVDSKTELEMKTRDLSMQLQAKSMEAEQFFNQLKEATAEVTKANEIIEAKETEVGLLRAEVSKFVEMSAALEQNVAKLSAELDSNQSMVAMLNKQVTQTNKELENYSHNLAEKEEQIASLKTVLKGQDDINVSLKTQLTEKEKEVNEHAIALQSKTDDEKRLFVDLNNALEEVKELSERLAAKDKNSAELETKMAELFKEHQLVSNSVMEFEKKTKDLSMQLQAKSSEVENLSRKLEDASSELTMRNKTLEAKETEIDGLQVEILHLVEKSTNCEQNIAELTAQLDTNNAAIAELNELTDRTLARKDDEISSLQIAIDNLNETRVSLEMQLVDTKQLIAQHEVAWQSQKSEVDELNQKLIETTQLAESLSETLLCKDQEVSSLVEKISELTTENQRLIESAAANEDQVSNLSSNLMLKTEELTKLQGELVESFGTVAILKSNMSALELQCNNLESELNSLKTVEAVEKEKMSILSAELNSEKLLSAELKDRVQLAQQNLDEIDGIRSKQEAEIITLKKSITQLSDENMSLVSRLSNSEKMIKDQSTLLEAKSSEISMNLDRARAQVEELSQSLSEKDQNILLLEAKVAELTTNNEMLIHSDAETRSSADQLSLALQSRSEELAMLNADLTRCMKENDRLNEEAMENCLLIANLSAKIEDQEKCLQAKIQDVSHLDAKVSELSGDLNQMKALKVANIQKIKELTSELESNRATIQSLDEQLKKLKEENVAFEIVKQCDPSEVENLRDQVNSLTVEADKLNKSLADKKLAEDSLLAKLKEQEAKLDSLQKDYDVVKLETDLKFQIVNEALSQKSEEANALTKQMQYVNLELDAKCETIMAMNEILKALKAQLKSSENDVSLKDEFIATLKDDLKAVKASLDEFKLSFNRNSIELSDLKKEKELGEVRIAKLEEERAHMALAYSTVESSIVELKTMAESEKMLKSEIESLRQKLETKDETIAEFKEKLLLANENLTSEIRESSKLKSEKDRLEATCESSLEKIKRLSNQLEKNEVSVQRLSEEKRNLENKLNLKAADIDRYVGELEILRKSLTSHETVNSRLQKELESLTASHNQQISRLESEKTASVEKLKKLKEDFENMNAKFVERYEDKLVRLKSKMKQVYNEKMEELLTSHAKEVDSLREEWSREKSKRQSLEVKVRQLSDELLIAQEETRSILTNSSTFKQPYPHGMSNPGYSSPPLARAQSLDRIPSRRGLDNLGADFSFNDSLNSRRSSTSSNRSAQLPKGIGKIFPAAEEDGEVFDDRCLADLKNGVCNVASSSGVERMSILKQRNSMCPPHLKSSYPVETQFFRPDTFREDELKITNENRDPAETRRSTIAVTPSKLKALFRRKEQ